jgi:hypothetical protein
MTDKSQIIDAIEALALHCRPPLMAIEQREAWIRDWCADLEEFPLEAIQNACRKWRHSGATKFPTAGQLLPLIRENVPRDDGPALQVWREAGPDEYRAMSVREKIREHQILAHAAFGKAGPMFRNTSGGGVMAKASGTHLTAEQMPDSHRAWIAEARRHTAEVARLREYLNAEPRRAEG